MAGALAGGTLALVRPAPVKPVSSVSFSIADCVVAMASFDGNSVCAETVAGMKKSSAAAEANAAR